MNFLLYWCLFPSWCQFCIKDKRANVGFMQKPAEAVLVSSFLCILKRQLSMDQYSQYEEKAPQEENHKGQGIVLSTVARTRQC